IWTLIFWTKERFVGECMVKTGRRQSWMFRTGWPAPLDMCLPAVRRRCWTRGNPPGVPLHRDASLTPGDVPFGPRYTEFLRSRRLMHQDAAGYGGETGNDMAQ